jgi:hypothetical protein
LLQVSNNKSNTFSLAKLNYLPLGVSCTVFGFISIWAPIQLLFFAHIFQGFTVQLQIPLLIAAIIVPIFVLNFAIILIKNISTDKINCFESAESAYIVHTVGEEADEQFSLDLNHHIKKSRIDWIKEIKENWLSHFIFSAALMLCIFSVEYITIHNINVASAFTFTYRWYNSLFALIFLLPLTFIISILFQHPNHNSVYNLMLYILQPVSIVATHFLLLANCDYIISDHIMLAGFSSSGYSYSLLYAIFALAVLCAAIYITLTALNELVLPLPAQLLLNLFKQLRAEHDFALAKLKAAKQNEKFLEVQLEELARTVELVNFCRPIISTCTLASILANSQGKSPYHNRKQSLSIESINRPALKPQLPLTSSFDSALLATYSSKSFSPFFNDLNSNNSNVPGVLSATVKKHSQSNNKMASPPQAASPSAEASNKALANIIVHKPQSPSIASIIAGPITVIDPAAILNSKRMTLTLPPRAYIPGSNSASPNSQSTVQQQYISSKLNSPSASLAVPSGLYTPGSLATNNSEENTNYQYNIDSGRMKVLATIPASPTASERSQHDATAEELKESKEGANSEESADGEGPVVKHQRKPSKRPSVFTYTSTSDTKQSSPEEKQFFEQIQQFQAEAQAEEAKRQQEELSKKLAAAAAPSNTASSNRTTITLNKLHLRVASSPYSPSPNQSPNSADSNSSHSPSTQNGSNPQTAILPGLQRTSTVQAVAVHPAPLLDRSPIKRANTVRLNKRASYKPSQKLEHAKLADLVQSRERKRSLVLKLERSPTDQEMIAAAANVENNPGAGGIGENSVNRTTPNPLDVMLSLNSTMSEAALAILDGSAVPAMSSIDITSKQRRNEELMMKLCLSLHEIRTFEYGAPAAQSQSPVNKHSSPSHASFLRNNTNPNISNSSNAALVAQLNSIQLFHILAHPASLELFKDSVMRDQSLEILQFYLSIQRLKLLQTRQALIVFAYELRQMFVAGDCAYPVPLSTAAREKIENWCNESIRLLQNSENNANNNNPNTARESSRNSAGGWAEPGFDNLGSPVAVFELAECELYWQMENYNFVNFKQTEAFRLSAYILGYIPVNNSNTQVNMNVQSTSDHPNNATSSPQVDTTNVRNIQENAEELEKKSLSPSDSAASANNAGVHVTINISAPHSPAHPSRPILAQKPSNNESSAATEALTVNSSSQHSSSNSKSPATDSGEANTTTNNSGAAAYPLDAAHPAPQLVHPEISKFHTSTGNGSDYYTVSESAVSQTHTADRLPRYNRGSILSDNRFSMFSYNFKPPNLSTVASVSNSPVPSPSASAFVNNHSLTTTPTATAQPNLTPNNTSLNTMKSKKGLGLNSPYSPLPGIPSASVSSHSSLAKKAAINSAIAVAAAASARATASKTVNHEMSPFAVSRAQ